MKQTNRTLRPFTVLALDTAATYEGESQPRYIHRHVKATSSREAFLVAADAHQSDESESILYLCAVEGTHDHDSAELSLPFDETPADERTVWELPDAFATEPLTHTETAQSIEEAALSLREIVDLDMPRKSLTADNCKRQRMLTLIDEVRQIAREITVDDMKPNEQSFCSKNPQSSRWL